MFRNFFLSLLVLMTGINTYSTTYYVSSSKGKNFYRGKTEDKPWRSLKKVNRKSLKPGDSVLFKRGDIWRGQLIPKTSGVLGNSIYFGAYGIGENPLFLGSISGMKENKWKKQNDYIWKLNLKRTKDVGNIIINNKANLVHKRTSLENLKKENDFFSTQNRLYWLSKKNPARHFNSIEICRTKNIVHVVNKSYLFFEDIAVKYGGAHGFYVNNTSNITIKSCDISYIGGGYLNIGERFGNGVEFWESNSNCIVENCLVEQIYDSGLTNQGRNPNGIQQNITYRNNTISNCGLASFEYFNSSHTAITDSIIFENNISKNAGFGWAPPRAGNYGGYHLLFHRGSAKTTNFIIKKNNFYNSKRAAIMFYSKGKWSGFENLVFDNNTYYYANKEQYLFRKFTDGKGWENYKFQELKQYIKKIKKDKTSIFKIKE